MGWSMIGPERGSILFEKNRFLDIKFHKARGRIPTDNATKSKYLEIYNSSRLTAQEATYGLPLAVGTDLKLMMYRLPGNLCGETLLFY